MKELLRLYTRYVTATEKRERRRRRGGKEGLLHFASKNKIFDPEKMKIKIKKIKFKNIDAWTKNTN